MRELSQIGRVLHALRRTMRSCRPCRGVLSRGVTFGGATLLALGCGSDPVGPNTGQIAVTVTTRGGGPDPDGYTRSLDGHEGVAIAANAARTLTVDQGSHTLALGGLAATCE